MNHPAEEPVDYNVPARVEPDEGDKPELTFMGLATTSGPLKYSDPAFIALDDGAGGTHFMPVSDDELRKLITDAQDYDPESTRCYDCKNMAVDDCWLTGWFDNCGIDELLVGSLEVTVDATWGGDHPRVEIVEAAQPPNVLTPDEARLLAKALGRSTTVHETRFDPLIDRLSTYADEGGHS